MKWNKIIRAAERLAQPLAQSQDHHNPEKTVTPGGNGGSEKPDPEGPAPLAAHHR